MCPEKFTRGNAIIAPFSELSDVVTFLPEETQEISQLWCALAPLLQ